MLDSEPGRVSVQSFADDSAAERAGLAPGDRVVSLQGRPVSDFTGITMGLLGKRPGDRAFVEVERKTGDGSAETLLFEVTLR